MRALLFFLFMVFLLSCDDKGTHKVNNKNTNWDIALEFRESGKSDSSFLYFSRAKVLFVEQNDSLGIGKCLLNMAKIATEEGDYFAGHELSLNAKNYFNPRLDSQKAFLSANFNNLATTAFKLRNYRAALLFNNSAIEYSRDAVQSSVYLSRRARIYQAIGNFDEAITIYRDILSRPTTNKIEYASVISNLAMVRWEQNPMYSPQYEFHKALSISEKNNYFLEINESYKHLTRYYFYKNPDSALFYASKMYQVSRKIRSGDDQLIALENLVKLSPNLQSKAYFNRFQFFSDSVRTVRNRTKNQFALVRYETEKDKAEDLELQQDIASRRYQIVKEKILLYGAIIVLFSSAVIAVSWYNRRGERLNMEAHSTIRANQLSTSKKVHDVVANGLYRLMAEMQNFQNADVNSLLDKIEDLYEKSRDISYEETAYCGRDFQKEVASLITSFASENVKVALVGNTESLWQCVHADTKYELQQIIQELMVNMKKHSGANQVAICFEQMKRQILIRYTDNGIGMLKATHFNNGLTNTKNRIKTIKGNINFDDDFDKGLKILIAFPIN